MCDAKFLFPAIGINPKTSWTVPQFYCALFRFIFRSQWVSLFSIRSFKECVRRVFAKVSIRFIFRSHSCCFGEIIVMVPWCWPSFTHRNGGTERASTIAHQTAIAKTLYVVARRLQMKYSTRGKHRASKFYRKLQHTSERKANLHPQGH